MKNINIIIIKNLSLLISSIQNKKILFYFFSHDYMNQIILHLSTSIEEQDMDYLCFYINFLKTIANKLDINSLSLFFHKEYNSFPLLDEVSIFFIFNDIMIKNTARNIFLSIIKLNYEPLIQYICDIPRITDLLLLADNIKSYIIYLTSINIDDNNMNISEIKLKIKEVEENIIDDFLFIQDILSIGILKINYILINCLFNIPLKYIFKCIVEHHNVNIAFYILNLLFKNINDECLNNLITFVLYSSQIDTKINEFISSQESQEIYNILYLNKIISHHSGCLNLLFEEYIILVFNQNFLKSMRFIKEDDKVFEEIIDISKYIKERKDDEIKDINIGIKIISEHLRKKDKLNQIIKKMEEYHNLISKYTGINLGISHSGSNNSILQLIRDNLFLYNEDTHKNNININNINENLIKKECFSLLDLNYILDNQYIYINQIFLILQIINNNKISIELKKFLYLNKHISIEEKIFESDESKNNNLNNENNLILKNIKLKNGNEENEENKYLISGRKRNEIIKDFFGISETKTDYDMLNNYFNNSTSETKTSCNNISNVLIPKPNNNDINDNIINFRSFNFNNKNLNKLFLKYNSKKQEEKYDNNIIFHDELLQKIIDIIFKNDKILTKLNYRLSLELIENLILGLENNTFYKDKYKDIIIKKYYQILNDINTILLNSNSTKTKIYKFAYQYLEESFILNKKKFNFLLNECIINYSLYFLLKLNNKRDKYFDIIDYPKKDNENLQCLFQALIGLCDLKNLFGFINENNKYKYLLRNVEFPFKLINSNQEKDGLINIKELNIKVNPVPVIYKSKNIEQQNFFIFTYQNYLFIVSPLTKKEEKSNFYFIEYKFPLRQILAYHDRGEPRTLYLLNKNETESTLFFNGVQQATNMKDNIINSIKLANLKEFSEVKKFINDLKHIDSFI